MLGLKIYIFFLINSLQFQASVANSCLFIKQSNSCSVYLLVYVDDIVVTVTSSSVISHVIHSINNEFRHKDLASLNYFLGMEVTTTDNYLMLNQKKNIHELIEKLGLTQAFNFPTPMTGSCLTKTCMISCTEIFLDDTLFRSTIGDFAECLHYLV